MGEEREDRNIDVAVLQEQVSQLRDRVLSMEKSSEAKFSRIEEKLDKALIGNAGKPSWGIALILGGLTTVCASLIVYVAMMTKVVS